MPKRTVILIDGGFLRAKTSRARIKYDPNFIEAFAHRCTSQDEEILRVLYYDCAPYSGSVKLPVSGDLHSFDGSAKWLDELARKDLFAVRRGVLKFRGFKPKQTPVHNTGPLTDADFVPDFEQKGVDMRIGLDIASYSHGHMADRIALISNDTDCVPALKYGRKLGLQIVIIGLLNCQTAPELIMHSDFVRQVPWP